MADDKKIPGQSKQAPPAAPGKPEAAVPPAEKPEQSTLDGFATPAGTDKPKTDPPRQGGSRCGAERHPEAQGR